MSQLQTKVDLTPQQSSYIQELRTICAPKTTDFAANIQMNDGDTRTFHFSPDPSDMRVVEYESKFKNEDGSARKQKKIVFTVLDPETDEKASLWLARTHADLVLKEIQQRNVMLTIERIGSRTGTNYRVRSAQ